MKYIKYLFAALLIALSVPTFAKDYGSHHGYGHAYQGSHHGYGHAYRGSHHGYGHAYRGSHHGKGYYRNKAHGDHRSDRHNYERGYR
ncbi:hypothetical protein I5515_04840 [Acinetobacter calcoaceticus]|uniref:hypothetical protein n=1 Tax=Acinetobacter calcoaceticus TaxID=471 RepID=UPI0019021EE8|nr:hypothetical protein [Acinetobacter calcoaceticus]MBJ9721121.1 hypothetical protein [Acinetobacter calcoaceticus]